MSRTVVWHEPLAHPLQELLRIADFVRVVCYDIAVAYLSKLEIDDSTLTRGREFVPSWMCIDHLFRPQIKWAVGQNRAHDVDLAYAEGLLLTRHPPEAQMEMGNATAHAD
jgi:hypothetical protein